MAKFARRRSVVRYRARRRADSKTTIPLAVVAGFVPLAVDVVKAFQSDGIDGAGRKLCSQTTGYDPADHQWRFEGMMQGLGPIILGFGVHKLASMLGINRALGRAKIPLLRI
jgi:hypothetical protein